MLIEGERTARIKRVVLIKHRQWNVSKRFGLSCPEVLLDLVGVPWVYELLLELLLESMMAWPLVQYVTLQHRVTVKHERDLLMRPLLVELTVLADDFAVS